MNGHPHLTSRILASILVLLCLGESGKTVYAAGRPSSPSLSQGDSVVAEKRPRFLPTDQPQTGQQAATPSWRTGKELDDYLARPISVSLSDAPFKERILNFARQQRIAIFVDRRIDPTTIVDISMQNVSVEQFLWAVAKQEGWGVCRLGDFYYIGPPETTDRLPILWEELKRETYQIKRKQKTTSPWHQTIASELPPLTIPAERLNRLAEQYHFQIQGEALPHDLWGAVSLPPMTLDRQVALLVVGFGKWIKRSPDGQQVTLMDLPALPRAKRSLGRIEDRRATVKALRTAFPDCRFSTQGKRLFASGSPRQLAAVRAHLVTGQAVNNVPDTAKRFSLTTQSSRGSILATIAQQTGRRLEFDPSLQATLGEVIKLDVQNVTLEELLSAVLKGTDAHFRMTDQVLNIVPNASE